MIKYPDRESSPDEPNEPPARAVRFPDLRSAGRELALALKKYRDRDAVVLAPVLGGVLVAHEVARYLHKPLDFVISRRLLLPRGPGSDVNAVSVAGTLIIDDEAPAVSDKPSTPLEYFLADAVSGLNAREKICRGNRPPLPLHDKTVILVDCGIHTAGTIQTAIKALRRVHPKQIIVAVPVTSRGGAAIISEVADDLVYLFSPKLFGHVGLWYADFRRPGDDEISDLLSV